MVPERITNVKQLGASPAKTTTTGASAARSKAVNNTAAPKKVPDIQWTYSRFASP